MVNLTVDFIKMDNCMDLVDLILLTEIFMMENSKKDFFQGKEYFIKNRMINMFLECLKKTNV